MLRCVDRAAPAILCALAATLLAAAPPAAGPERVEALYERYHREFPEVADITAGELLRRLGEEALVLVDVRSAAEQAISRIPGAITREEFEANPPTPEEVTVVTYCTVGYRSGLYARELSRHGWQVRNLRGSLLAWTWAGGPLVDPAGLPTRRLHVYGGRWDLAAPGYETVW